MDVIHTAIRVSDLDGTLPFYRDGLGLDVTNEFERDGVTSVFLGSEDGAEIQLSYDPEDDEPVEPSGIDHLAVAASDVDAEVERLREEWNCPVHVEPTTIDVADARVAFVEDPEGYVVEIVEAL